MTQISQKVRFVILAVLDGWGIAAKGPGNAITLANTPNMDRFQASYPHTQLEASGQAVGLPRGEDGNTETGHLNLGAGRIVYQDLERINMAIADGTFYENKVLISAINHARQFNSRLHIMGLIGAGGVHSNIEHLFALLELARKLNFQNVYLHLFTDGRDSPPTAALSYIKMVMQVLEKEKVGQIASIMGRYWAMDRDLRWERTKVSYFALTKGIANKVSNVTDAVNESYSRGKTDEFIEPYLIVRNNNTPVALIEENDACVFFNFRIDRPRQLTAAFVMEDFALFQNELDDYSLPTQKPFEKETLKNLFFVTMTEYSKKLVAEGARPAFPPEKVDVPLGLVISSRHMKQLRITESEKERFVTVYFNGLNEEIFLGEDRIIIPSPKVSTYDLFPQMSALKLTERLMKELSRDIYKFILVNFPNPDMVGHTGNIGSAVTAIETVDECIGRIANFTLAHGGALIITSDHGNAEEMINAATGEIDTEHSLNKVPFILVSRLYLGNPRTLAAGILADIAPTVLYLLDVEKPSAMTGQNLLKLLEEGKIGGLL